MTEPETARPASPAPSYLSLKLGSANKTGSRSQGAIHYRILTDSDQQQLSIILVGNDGDGCYSKEVVPFAKIEQCLQGFDPLKPIASKLFQQAFIGRSSNNAGFLAAILRAEQLLAPVPEAVHQHAIQPDWPVWKTAMLALAATAEPYQPELPKSRIKQKTIQENSAPESRQPPLQASQAQPAGAETPVEADPGTPVSHHGGDQDAELDEVEMELLQRSALTADITRQQDEDEAEPANTVTTVLNKQQSKKQRHEKRPHPTATTQESRP